jgi:hypothetical protein
MRDNPEGEMNMPDKNGLRNFRNLSSSDLAAAFADARQRGLHIDAIVAVDATPQMLEDYFSWKGDDAFHPVLRGTPYASLWASMPYLSRIGEGSRLETHLLAEHLAWGFFAVTAANEQTHCGHWRSLCEVLLPSGKKSFFRFQDPGGLEKMLPTFSDQELGWFLGLAARLFIPIRNHDGERSWLDVPSPVLSGRTERELADLYRPTKGLPWWEVREEHLGGLSQENRAALIYNLSQDLKEKAPVTAALAAEHYGSLETAVGEYVDAAMRYGLADETHIFIFLRLCLTMPFGAQNDRVVRDAMQDASSDPVSALDQLRMLVQLKGESL